MHKITKFIPMRSDVLLVKRPDEQRGLIVYKEFSDESSQHYIVDATGPDVFFSTKSLDQIITS